MKSLVVGELLRYLRTNTFQHDFVCNSIFFQNKAYDRGYDPLMLANVCSAIYWSRKDELCHPRARTNTLRVLLIIRFFKNAEELRTTSLLHRYLGHLVPGREIKVLAAYASNRNVFRFIYERFLSVANGRASEA